MKNILTYLWIIIIACVFTVGGICWIIARVKDKTLLKKIFSKTGFTVMLCIAFLFGLSILFWKVPASLDVLEVVVKVWYGFAALCWLLSYLVLAIDKKAGEKCMSFAVKLIWSVWLLLPFLLSVVIAHVLFGI